MYSAPNKTEVMPFCADDQSGDVNELFLLIASPSSPLLHTYAIAAGSI